MPREEWLIPKRDKSLPPSPLAQARRGQLLERKVGSVTVDVVDQGRTVRVHAPGRYLEVWRLQAGCDDLYELREAFPFAAEPEHACAGAGPFPCPTCQPGLFDAWTREQFGLSESA